MRYLDVIEKLNDRVMALSEENIRVNNLINKMKIERDGKTCEYNMVAEPPVSR